MSGPILEVRDLSVAYRVGGLSLEALKSVSLDLHEGEVVGVVGESGCGKSTLSLALLDLLPHNGEVTGGEVVLAGEDLTGSSPRRLRSLRGSKLAMIFQDPSTSLNPTFTVGGQMREVLRAHPEMVAQQRKAMDSRVVEMLTAVGLPDPEETLARYPHELSGGMQQRVMIAMALMLEPSVLIADEPTSALDVTLQAQILGLLQDLARRLRTGTLLISHDLAAVSSVCDRVVVMYGGQAVETGDVGELFASALHPYTRGLLRTVPSHKARDRPLAGIPGRVPPLVDLPGGCVYADRCPHAREACQQDRPREIPVGERRVRCIAYDPSSDYGEPPDELNQAAAEATG